MKKRICCKVLSMETGKKACCAEEDGKVSLSDQLLCSPPPVLREIDRELVFAISNISKILNEVLLRLNTIDPAYCPERPESLSNDGRLMYIENCLIAIQNARPD